MRLLPFFAVHALICPLASPPRTDCHTRPLSVPAAGALLNSSSALNRVCLKWLRFSLLTTEAWDRSVFELYAVCQLAVLVGVEGGGDGSGAELNSWPLMGWSHTSRFFNFWACSAAVASPTSVICPADQRQTHAATDPQDVLFPLTAHRELVGISRRLANEIAKRLLKANHQGCRCSAMLF